MKKIVFSKQDLDFIIQQYTNHTMTTLELANRFNCSRSTIEKRLKENNIELKKHFSYEDLTGKKFGQLTVLKSNEKRHQQDLLKTKKPHRYWWCQCDCGNIIQVESSHLKNGHTTSCGCVKSLAEKKISNLLKQNNILFIKEYSFKNLKGVGHGSLRYDFAILNDNKEVSYLIQYHGKQHYEQNGGWNTKYQFETRQANDKIKQEYAKNNNIPLIIIPYTITPQKIKLQYLLYKE